MSSKQTSSDQINTLIRARLPVVWVVSYEEFRVEESINAMVDENNSDFGTEIKVWNWSFTTGLNCPANEISEPELIAPSAILSRIQDHEDQAVFILRDFGHFLNSGNSYPVQRKLRDVASVITSTGVGITIIILDSKLEVPDRIEKEVAIIDYDLPTEAELSVHLSSIISACPALNDLSEADAKGVVDKGISSARGLTLTEAENTFAKSLAETATIDPDIIIGEKKHIIRRSGVLEFYDVEADMSVVGGLDVLKGWLRNRSRAYSQEARDYGLPAPKGMLLVGIPGTGKSLIAKCVGKEWNMPVLRMDVGALFGSYVGQSEANMRKALQVAEALAPCVLWIDEVEKSIGGGGGTLDGGTTARVFGSFLSWMQEKTADVFVVATANDVSALPPEMLRKGRFDELFFCDLPDLASRKEILAIHIKKVNRKPEDFNLDALAMASVDLSGAEIEAAIQSSLYKAFDRNEEPTDADITAALKGTVPLLTTMKEKITSLRQWANKRAKLASSALPESAQELRKKKNQKNGVVRRPVLPGAGPS
jgi:SpoVK/Ycf46/Vps4 family AAA+-type ATPase